MKNNIIVISGSAGAGKGTIVKYLKQHTDCFFSVSTTSRAIRNDDIPGVTYNFVTKEQFIDLIGKGEFLEYATFSDNYYGTPMTPINNALSEGKNVVLEIETQGAENVKNHYPDAIMIWITPPNRTTLEKRLRNRGNNKEDDIIKRLKTATEEFEKLDLYDYIVVNNDGQSDIAGEQVLSIINGESSADSLLVSKNQAFREAFYC